MRFVFLFVFFIHFTSCNPFAFTADRPERDDAIGEDVLRPGSIDKKPLGEIGEEINEGNPCTEYDDYTNAPSILELGQEILWNPVLKASISVM